VEAARDERPLTIQGQHPFPSHLDCFLHATASPDSFLVYKPEELPGGYMAEHVHPEDRGNTLIAARRILSGEPTARLSSRRIHKQGYAVATKPSANWFAERGGDGSAV
jgi:hypothetical protein